MARILVVEDNPTNLDLVVYLLQAFKHTTYTARSGEDGLAVAQREDPDLILLDVQMPDVDGYEVVRRLKAHPKLRTIPVVAVTALAMVGDRERLLAAGFDGYIAKPIEPESFLIQMRALVATAAAPLPAAPAPPTTAAATAPAQPPAPPRGTVLIVDNAPDNIVVARNALEPAGYRVLAAEGIDAALEVLRHGRVDVVLSDLHLWRESGFDLLRIVRREWGRRAAPVIVQSASLWPERDEREALALGARSFIPRPIESRVLIALVDTCLRGEGAGGATGDDDRMDPR